MEYESPIELAERVCKVTLAHARFLRDTQFKYADDYTTSIIGSYFRLLPNQLQADAGDSDLFEKSPDNLMFRLFKF